MKSFTHIIFDFDGVIADTENVFATFDCRLLNDVLERAGLPPSLTPHDIRQLAGNNDAAKLAIIAKRYDFDPTPHQDEFIKTRSAQRKTLFRDSPAPIGANLMVFLNSIKGRNALATNKTAAKLFYDLELMALDTLFDTIITCDPPLRKKPAPDMLLEAAKRLNAHPENCAYIGDNTLDIQAAIAAQMIPIGFIIEGTAQHPTREQELKDHGAHIIIDDFMAITPYLIKP